MFTRTLSALVVAAALGLSMGAAQARDFDHRAGGQGFQHADHRGASHHGHHNRHHQLNRHHNGGHNGRR